MSSSRTLLNSRLFLSFIFGISSGLPLVAAGGTLQIWMKNAGLDLKTIGLFSLAGLPYSYKFLWSPVMDRYSIGDFGRRRGWMIVTQSLLIVGFIALSRLDPATQLFDVALLALCISFVSASQDIVLDAYRRDILLDEELGLGSSLFVAGYRVGLLLAGALALWFSSYVSWPVVYCFLAAWIAVGLCATIISPEPDSHGTPPRTILESIRDPLQNFFSRRGAYTALLFALLYKLGDTLAAAMSSQCILEMGFTNAELGIVGKTFGLTSAIVGGIIGGTLITRLGLFRSLMLFGVVQMLGILPFSYLAVAPKSTTTLAYVISIENLTSGMGTAAFLAFLAKLCDRRYSATQYALLTSIVALPRTLLASGTGYLALAVGWYTYFIVCTLAAIPGLLLLISGKRWGGAVFNEDATP